MNGLHFSLILAVLIGGVSAAAGFQGTLQVDIQSPSSGLVLPSDETWVEVKGSASTFGGMKQLDLMLVMDTSSSLEDSDPNDDRLAGAIRLVESLPAKSDTRIGIVEFDSSSELVLPLTSNRSEVIDALHNLDRSGSTDLADGIQTALSGLESDRRPDAVQMMLVFTDGKSKKSGFKPAARNEKLAVRAAVRKATEQSVAIHSLLLGSDKIGAENLREIASQTRGSFVQVTDPRDLPDAFMNLRTAGVDHVTVQVGNSAPVLASLIGSSFSAYVSVDEGVNEIVATATSLHGVRQREATTVRVREPGCAELQVEARLDGSPALSVSDRAVEIVIDASRSMWGRMQGRPKMSVAKETVDAAVNWLSGDLDVSLRAYGNAHAREQHNCRDSELLVSLARNNRDEIHEAIAGLSPKGQTPLAYALEQVASDFAGYAGERAVVLVTDGIESCGGDPVAAARALQQQGPTPVHVIGFGLSSAEDEDLESLQAIAEASGGRFVTAGSADELREALGTVVGTPFEIWRGQRPVARGALGSDEQIHLPGGDYALRLESLPPREVKIRLESEEKLTLVFDREMGQVADDQWRAPTEYMSCGTPMGFSDSMPAAPADNDDLVPASTSPDRVFQGVKPGTARGARP